MPSELVTARRRQEQAVSSSVASGRFQVLVLDLEAGRPGECVSCDEARVSQGTRCLRCDACHLTGYPEDHVGPSD